eukprot:EG_transcript_32454
MDSSDDSPVSSRTRQRLRAQALGSARPATRGRIRGSALSLPAPPAPVRRLQRQKGTLPSRQPKGGESNRAGGVGGRRKPPSRSKPVAAHHPEGECRPEEADATPGDLDLTVWFENDAAETPAAADRRLTTADRSGLPC